MSAPAPVVSVVMVAFGGGWPWVPRALEELRKNTAETYEVILVDNGGGEARPALDDSNVELIRNTTNLGFGVGSNQGAARARGEVLVFLNTDVLVQPGWLAPLLERLGEDGVGAVFPAKLNVDGTMQEAGAFVTGEANAYVFGDGDAADLPEHAFPREVDFGSAAAMGMTRAGFEHAFGFDPLYRVAYYEDADLCFRLREDGLLPVYEPRSRVTHARSVSAPSADLADVYVANRDVFLRRWRDIVEDRPSYDRLVADPRARLEARDVHAPHRALLAGGTEAEQQIALRLASAQPRARVTLLVEQIEPARQRALLATRVEVAQTDAVEEWLGERAGHYTHVLVPQELDRLEALRKSQPGAAFLSGQDLENAFGNAS